MNVTSAANRNDAMSMQSVAGFLDDFSMEITPRHLDGIDGLAARLKPGTHVYVAMIEVGDHPGVVAAARALRAAGLEPVPHIPARFVSSARVLNEWLGAYVGEADVKTALVLGGGAATPSGEFDAAVQLMRTGLFTRHGVTKLGVAGHPEGNPDIEKAVGKAAILQALRDKQEFAEDAGIEAHIVTQFLFEAGPVESWAGKLRNDGIVLPIHVGVPGPATLKTLVKYAAVCGVGASAAFVRKQALNVTRLMSVNKPDDLIAGLAALRFDKPELGVRRAHLYPFGGFDRLFEWIDETIA